MWRLKVLAQSVLALLPGGERLNFRIQQASGSHSPERSRARALGVASSLAAVREHADIRGAAVAEVGTGWDAIGSVLLHLAGAGEIHTFDHLPTYVKKRLPDGALEDFNREAEVMIGHDGLVGHGAIIFPGVSVGSGAVIAAGAVVTKAVSPYAIVAGVPARAIGRRFGPELVALLLSLEWWNLPHEELADPRTLFMRDFAEASRRASA